MIALVWFIAGFVSAVAIVFGLRLYQAMRRREMADDPDWASEARGAQRL